MPSRPETPRARRIRATVLFADLVGFTEMSEKLGVEHAYGAVTGCLKLLDGIARKHGGSVDKYQGDCLMAVFGYPLEGSASQGLAAALEMRQGVYDYNRDLELAVPLDVHIGLETGPMVAGDIRGPVVREFHVLGDTVNVSARLKAKAPVGSIYVGPGAREEAGPELELRELAPLALKGKSRPVAAFELVASREGRRATTLGAGERSFSPLIGRDEERDRLRAALARLAGGRGGLVTIAGEAGTGKSRLLAELGREPDVAALEVVQLRPPPGGESAPGELLGELASALGGARGRDPTAAAEAAIADAAARRPLLIALDDLERARPDTLEALARLAARATRHPVLLVFAGQRAGDLAALAEAIRPTVEPEAIALGPLSADASRRLLEAVATDPLDEATVGLIEARAQGNPSRLILGAFLGPALHSERERGSAHAERSREAERRRATILFADITGFTAMTERLGPERAYPVVADCLELLADVARSHGGTVEKYLGDCVMALFGIPEAIEDAPRAAVNAAIEMRRRLREAQGDAEGALDVHIGIHTGQSIAGDISGPLIREFAVMGEPVVVASQLTDAAEAGQVFTGPETWRFTRERFEFRERDPVPIPGREGGVVVHELLSETEQRYRRRAADEREIFSEVVGRDAEMERLGAAVARLVDGRGGFVTLAAEAGVGKSRIVEELGRLVEDEVTWLEGRSLSTGSGLSFHPFGDLLRALAQVDDGDDEGGVTTKLVATIERLLPGEVDDVVPFLGTVMGARLGAAHRERLDSLQGDLLDRVIRASVARVLERLAGERPVVLLFDDLHWADASSIELLESLCALTLDHPVLFLLVFRPHFAGTSERVLESLREQHAARLEEIELQPLDRESVRLLVNNLFRGADLPQRVRARIVERVAGNPFFVEEVVRSLVEQGAVEREGDGFRVTPRIHTVEIPGTVQETVMARIDRLPLRQREVVHTASVVGRSFHFDVLRDVFPDKDTLLEDLEDLQHGGFIVPWDRLQGLEFAFKHPLSQEVAYDSLLEARRRELHLRVGSAIETTLTENVPGYHAMLAYHFSMGRDLERAEDSLFRAGDEASRTAASNEALRFFREASSLYVELHPDGGDPVKRARLERSIGLALHNRGQLIEAEPHLNAALRLLGEPVPHSQAALILRFVGNLARVLARLYLPSRPPSPATDVDREVIALMMKRAEAQTYVSPTRFVFDSIDTVARLDRVDPKTVPGAGGFYSGTVGIFTYGGLSPGVSRRFLDRAAPLVRSDDAREAIFFGAMRHMHDFFAGSWADDQRVDESVVEAGLRTMQLWPVVTYLQLLAEQHLRRGAFDEAATQIARIDRIWESWDYDYAKTNHYWLPTLMALERRQLAEAERAAQAYYDEIPEDLLHILALSARSTALTLRGELDAAGEALVRAAELVRIVRFPPVYQAAAYQAARLQLDVAQLERETADGRAPRSLRRAARQSARAALRAARAAGYRQPEAYRLEGRRRWLLGHRGEACAWWQRSLDAAARLGLEPERARTEHELAVRLAGDAGRTHEGQGAADWSEAARRRYGALGLDFDLERLDAGNPP